MAFVNKPVVICGMALAIFFVLMFAPYHVAPDTTCSTIHRPKSGCPKGYAQEKHPRFTEKDGSHQFACVSRDPAKEPCLDELRPGETVRFEFATPAPDKPEPARDEGPKT
jgi:hypothetical protein